MRNRATLFLLLLGLSACYEIPTEQLAPAEHLSFQGPFVGAEMLEMTAQVLESSSLSIPRRRLAFVASPPLIESAVRSLATAGSGSCCRHHQPPKRLSRTIGV